MVKEFKQGIHEFNVIYEPREKDKVIRNLGQVGIDRTMVEEHIFGMVTIETEIEFNRVVLGKGKPIHCELQHSILRLTVPQVFQARFHA